MSEINNWIDKINNTLPSDIMKEAKRVMIGSKVAYIPTKVPVGRFTQRHISTTINVPRTRLPSTIRVYRGYGFTVEEATMDCLSQMGMDMCDIAYVDTTSFQIDMRWWEKLYRKVGAMLGRYTLCMVQYEVERYERVGVAPIKERVESFKISKNIGDI